MINLKNLKPNVPKVDLSEYFYVVAGIPKSGKTSLFAKMVEKYYGNVDKGILIAFEKGYQALKVNAVDVEEFDDFEETVDQLVEEKDDLPFKFVGIDTADILWEMTQDKVVEEWNIENPNKRAKDIAGVGAKKAGGQGFGVGYQRAKQKVRKQIDRLMKAGYSVVILTHSKDKEIEEKNGLTYDQLVVSLPNSAREIFVNMADFITFITIEKLKNSDDEVETKRFMYFRTDGYVEAGSRFQNIPERIEYDVDGFISTIENAIKSEFKEGTDLEEIRQEQEEEKEEKAKEFVEKEKIDPKELQKEFKDTLRDLSQEGKQQLKQKLTDELGTTKVSELKDVDDIQQAVGIAKSLK